MSGTNVAHSYNQMQTSWTDGNQYAPFKGLKSVSHKKSLSDYAEELVSMYAKFDGGSFYLLLSYLSDADQNEIVRLYMESTNRETGECVHGNDFSTENNYTCALLEMLKDDCPATRAIFAEVTRNNILAYYATALQGVLDEACNDYECNMMIEQDYHQSQDRNSGEYGWSR